eukprot:13721811-Alexandrium_andersonii.AAC.1
MADPTHRIILQPPQVSQQRPTQPLTTRVARGRVGLGVSTISQEGRPAKAPGPDERNRAASRPRRAP